MDSNPKEAEEIKAFLADVKEVEDKHGIQLMAVLDVKPSGITPSFRFVKKEGDKVAKFETK